MVRMIASRVRVLLAVLVAAPVAFLEATPAPAGSGDCHTGGESGLRAITGAECTAERLGTTIAAVGDRRTGAKRHVVSAVVG